MAVTLKVATFGTSCFSRFLSKPELELVQSRSCDNQVVAVDQVAEGLRATAQISITVLDVNDHSPQFPAIPDPLLILEGEYSEGSPGVVHTILPTDADLGSNGEVTVSLSAPHPLFRFREVRGCLDMSISSGDVSDV